MKNYLQGSARGVESSKTITLAVACKSKGKGKKQMLLGNHLFGGKGGGLFKYADDLDMSFASNSLDLSVSMHLTLPSFVLEISSSSQHRLFSFFIIVVSILH